MVGGGVGAVHIRLRMMQSEPLPPPGMAGLASEGACKTLLSLCVQNTPAFSVEAESALLVLKTPLLIYSTIKVEFYLQTNPFFMYTTIKSANHEGPALHQCNTR
jgi:hypothetical protein